MSAWRQKQISPVVAWVVIIVVVVVAFAVVWRYTGGPGRRGLTEEQRKQLEQMFGNKAPGPGSAPSPGASQPTAPSTR